MYKQLINYYRETVIKIFYGLEILCKSQTKIWKDKNNNKKIEIRSWNKKREICHFWNVEGMEILIEDYDDAILCSSFQTLMNVWSSAHVPTNV